MPVRSDSLHRRMHVKGGAWAAVWAGPTKKACSQGPRDWNCEMASRQGCAGLGWAAAAGGGDPTEGELCGTSGVDSGGHDDEQQGGRCSEAGIVGGK